MGIKKLPYRLWISFLIFFISYITYSMKVNIGYSLSYIVAVPKEDTSKINDSSQTNSSYAKNQITPHKWTATDRFYIGSSYFWGYVISSVPAGFISECYGPYDTIMYSLILMVFANSACVRAAEWHYAALVTCRFILGLISGMILPALQTLITNWSPPDEKGKFTSALMGSALGITVCQTLMVPISDTLGWDWGFHFLSIQAGVICLAFGLLASDSPAKHKWVDCREKRLIRESQGNLVSSLKVFPPYYKMVTSIPFWALCLGHFGSMWGYYFKMFYIYPHFRPSLEPLPPELGIISTVLVPIFILILELAAGIGSGFLDDIFKVKSLSQKTLVRRCFIVFSHILPGILQILLFYSPNILVLYFLTAILFLTTFTSVGSNLQNVHDLAPNYAGSMYGVVNFIGEIPSIAIPCLMFYGMEQFNQSIISGSICIITGLIFEIFISADTQQWNQKPGQKLEEEVPIREDHSLCTQE